jgi:hypothetical protein
MPGPSKRAPRLALAAAAHPLASSLSRLDALERLTLVAKAEVEAEDHASWRVDRLAERLARLADRPVQVSVSPIPAPVVHAAAPPAPVVNLAPPEVHLTVEPPPPRAVVVDFESEGRKVYRQLEREELAGPRHRPRGCRSDGRGGSVRAADVRP